MTDRDDRLIEAAFDVIERVHNDRKKIKKLLRRGHARDVAGGSAEADGYPRSSGLEGSSSGGPRTTVPEDAHGPEETVELTATEVAVLARLARKSDDELRQTIRDAATTLKVLADAGGRLIGLADRLDSLNISPEALNRPKCYLCPKLVLDAGELTKAGQTYRVLVGDRTLGVCRWGYDNVTARRRAIDDGKPGFTTERLPTREEVDQHHAGKNVRVTP